MFLPHLPPCDLWKKLWSPIWKQIFKCRLRELRAIFRRAVCLRLVSSLFSSFSYQNFSISTTCLILIGQEGSNFSSPKAVAPSQLRGERQSPLYRSVKHYRGATMSLCYELEGGDRRNFQFCFAIFPLVWMMKDNKLITNGSSMSMAGIFKVKMIEWREREHERDDNVALQDVNTILALK